MTLGIGAHMMANVPGNEMFAIVTFAVGSSVSLLLSVVNLKRSPRQQWRALFALALISFTTLAVSVVWFWLAVNNWFR